MLKNKLSLKEVKDLLCCNEDIGFVEITPETAELILEYNNDRNRSISKNIVDFYKKEFDAGHYYISTTCLGFDKNGTLVDGQHRLRAIASSSDKTKVFKIGCMFNIKQEMDMDTGKNRTLKDNAVIFDECDERLKESKYSVCFDVIKSVCDFANGYYSNKKLSQRELMDIVNYFADDLVICVDEGLFERTESASQSVILAGYFVAYKCGVDLKVLKTVKGKMKTKDFAIVSPEDNPILGCLSAFNMLVGGGRELSTRRYRLILDCIKRASKKGKSKSYPKTYMGTIAPYVIDYIPHIKC